MTFDRAAADQAIKRYDKITGAHGYGTGDHVALSNALRDALAEIDRLTPGPPTADEMEALDYAIRVPVSEARLGYRPLWKLIRAIQESVIAAGWRPPRGPVTDEMVGAAAWAIARARFERAGVQSVEVDQRDADMCKEDARAALEAAEAKR